MLNWALIKGLIASESIWNLRASREVQVWMIKLRDCNDNFTSVNSELKNVPEEQKNLTEEQKNLTEEQKNLTEEQKNLTEEQKNLIEEQKNLTEELQSYRHSYRDQLNNLTVGSRWCKDLWNRIQGDLGSVRITCISMILTG